MLLYINVVVYRVCGCLGLCVDHGFMAGFGEKFVLKGYTIKIQHSDVLAGIQGIHFFTQKYSTKK